MYGYSATVYDPREPWSRPSPSYSYPACTSSILDRGSSYASTSSSNYGCGCSRLSPHPHTPHYHAAHSPHPQFPAWNEYHHSPNSTMSSTQVDRPVETPPEKASNMVPQDPREWSPYDVGKWLSWASRIYRIPNTFPERFQMNGKALCLMDVSMFLYRVPQGGDTLYQDFQGRLQRSLYEERAR